MIDFGWPDRPVRGGGYGLLITGARQADGSLATMRHYKELIAESLCRRLSNLLSGNSAESGSCILAFPFDVGLSVGGPFFVDLDKDGADEPQEGVFARKDSDLRRAPLQLLLDGPFHRI